MNYQVSDILIWMIGSSSIHHIHNRTRVILWNNLIEFIEYLIWLLTDWIFLNSIHSQQKILHFFTQPHWVYRVFYLNSHWFDLPQFKTFITGNGSFKETKSLSLSSIWFEFWLIGSSEIYYIQSKTVFILWNNLIEFIEYLIWIVIDWIFLNSPHSQQDCGHSLQQPHWVSWVFDLNNHWLDLPQFTTFETGTCSFQETTDRKSVV